MYTGVKYKEYLGNSSQLLVLDLKKQTYFISTADKFWKNVNHCNYDLDLTTVLLCIVYYSGWYLRKNTMMGFITSAAR